MKQYQKKPVVIEAIQFTGAKVGEMFMQFPVKEQDGKPILDIETLEGVLTAQEGDWIIKGVKGEFYTCKPDIFEQTYQEVMNEHEFQEDGEGAAE